MRAHAVSGGVSVQAVAGDHAVFLGFGLDPAARPGCLGFAVHRADHTEGEEYWLPGFKTFRSVVPAPDPQQMYPSWDHPVQSFYWGDYSAKPAHEYEYRIVPRYGTPGSPAAREGAEASVTVRTGDPAAGTHGIYFNRGVAASQAYARKFGMVKPDDLPAPLRAEAMAWLSRGLGEALLAFIGQAAGPGTALRAAVYEFTEPSVLAAFQAAHAAGADVRVVYHAKDDDTGTQNEQAIAASGISRDILAPRRNPVLAHNKFIVYGTAAGGGLAPVSVWTGSTNLSKGGIYGHSNVAHVVRDPAVAGRYLSYWDVLAQDPAPAALRSWVGANNGFDGAAALDGAVHTVFSPRAGLEPLTWYAQQFTGASRAGHITLPFGLTAGFEVPLEACTGDALHFLMLNAPDDHQAQWSKVPGVLVAVGAAGRTDELGRWAAEILTGFNPRVPYLHTKIILVDPLGPAPSVISGSANFSPASTDSNDENMLIIGGDPGVADVYFTEYARIFQHFYARWWAAQLTAGGDAPDSGFLAEDDGWQVPYFAAGTSKQRQRLLYSGEAGPGLT